ncbi:MAG: SpoIVB peptidase [Clostridia bacterium]|nr:SpoIVB peptidase [Clostridia bacterium]
MNQKRILKTIGCFLLMTLTVFTCISPVFGDTPIRAVMNFVDDDAEISVAATVGAEEFLPYRREEVRGLSVIPGGMAFGTKYRTDGLLVVGFSNLSMGQNPAETAGIRQKDYILACNGESLSDAARLSELVAESEGKTLYLTCRRAGKKFTAKVQPEKNPADGSYQIGLLLQDSGAGIGTVTFILPGSLVFAGLGHGICDADTGTLIPMQSGVVQNVTIHDVKKGTAGDPGELKGYFDPGVVGTLFGNATCGVWGIYDRLPADAGKAIPVGLRDEVKEGEATILCTTSEEGVKEYRVQISSISRGETGSKCFMIKVIDPELLEATGGIVQGMSGSPILQDGKLVGAVTHVLINEPTTGYGIFIENMLTHLPLVEKDRAAA